MKYILTVVFLLSSYASASFACEDTLSASSSPRISEDVRGWLHLDLLIQKRLVIKFAEGTKVEGMIEIFNDARLQSQESDAQIKVVLDKRSKLGILANQATVYFLLQNPEILSVTFDKDHSGETSGSSVGN